MNNTLTPNSQVTPSRALRLPRVCDLTGASRSTVWRWVKNDPDFPRPFHLSKSKSVTCWDEREILDFLEFEKAERAAR